MDAESQGVTASPQPQSTCPCCHTPSAGWAVCPRCVARVDADLADLVELHAMASDWHYLLPASRGTGRGTDRPIGVNVAALDLASGEHLLGVLESWERWWREHWRLSPYGEASASRAAAPHSPATPGVVSTATSRHLVGCVAFLRAWWPRAATVVEPPPGEFADEVRKLHRNALTALALTRFDRDPDPDAVEPPDYTIACPAMDASGRVCGHRIGMRRQPRPVDDRPPERVAVTCQRCGTFWEGKWLIRVAVDAGMDVAMTLEQAAELYGCTARTIQRKVRMGLLVRERGRYRVASLGDQLRAALDTPNASA